MQLYRFVVSACAFLLLGACAGERLIKVDGQYERQTRSEAEQQVADEYRRLGASALAREAQARSDKAAADERKDPKNPFLEWLADLLLSNVRGGSTSR